MKANKHKKLIQLGINYLTLHLLLFANTICNACKVFWFTRRNRNGPECWALTGPVY